MGRFRTWDLASGEPVVDILLPTIDRYARIHWLGQDYILIDSLGLLLVDVTRKIVLWEYLRSRSNDKDVVAAWQGSFWSVGTDSARRNAVLLPVRLPDEEASKVAEQLDPESTMIVRPGVAVSVDLKIPADAAKLAEIRSSLVQRLTANGLKVTDGQPLLLTATTGPGESHSVTYHGGLGGGQATVSVADQVATLRFVHQNQTVWKAEKVSGAPYFLTLEAGESIQQVVTEKTKPDLAFFTTVRIPTHLAKPLGEKQRAYGRSVLRDDGVIQRLPAS